MHLRNDIRLICSAAPGSPSQAALDLLASWTAADAPGRSEHDVDTH